MPEEAGPKKLPDGPRPPRRVVPAYGHAFGLALVAPPVVASPAGRGQLDFRGRDHGFEPSAGAWSPGRGGEGREPQSGRRTWYPERHPGTCGVTGRP